MNAPKLLLVEDDPALAELVEFRFRGEGYQVRTTGDGEPLVLVEANLGEGVVGAPLSKYLRYHTRICRPIGLTEDDRARVCTYAAERIGFDYDVKNIFDLLRYLFPLPVPQRWRRRMMAIGSGHPTRIICSALIAQAFEHVHYPILPKMTRLESETARRDAAGCDTAKQPDHQSR